MDWKTIEKNYEINLERIWLNNAGITPIGNRQKQTLIQYLEEYACNGIFSPNFSYPKVKANILKMLSGIIKVPERNLALIHNTSEGFNFLSKGLNLQSGDEIILLENEYPSNYYPWEHWKKKGVQIVFIPMCKTGKEFKEKIFERIQSSLHSSTFTPSSGLTQSTHNSPDKKIILSLSPVHWCTGIPLPMQEIGDFCKAHNIFLAIDGAQGLGNVPVHPEDWGADFLAGSAWKWLLGPLGLGVIYVSDRGLKELDPVFKGTQSVPNEMEYLPYKDEMKTTADRYEFSTPSFIDWVYWQSSLERITEIGIEKVQSRIPELSNYLFQLCTEAGIPTSWDDEAGQGRVVSGIISLDLTKINPSWDSNNWKNYLFEKNTIVAERMGMVRLSPHIYNSKTQLENVIRIIQNRR